VSVRSKQTGVTLIEAVLVLLLVSAIIVLGIRQFQRYERDNQIREVQASVDQLFEALAMYYQTYCRQNPAVVFPQPPTPAPVTVRIASGVNALVTTGYLSKWSPLVNAIVDTSYGEKGFTAQFLGFTSTDGRMPSSTFYNWTGNLSGTPSTLSATQVAFPQSAMSVPQNVGVMYVWISHIAMKLTSTLDPKAYQGRTGASCYSTNPLTPCATATACGGAGSSCYLIWESLPTKASRSSQSTLAPTMSRIKAFTNLYYTDDMYSASNPTWGASNNLYLCGG
jgi:type II secretory pathway pseudopilin PulG